MDLTPGQLATLRNLGEKHDGKEVDFVNIADAAALTGYGLAVRTPQGWSVTEAGRARLRTEGQAPPEASNIVRGEFGGRDT